MKRIPTEDLGRLLHAARKENRRDYVLLLLMANTGIRVGEAVAVNVSDLYGLRKNPPFLMIHTAKRRRPRWDEVYLTAGVARALRKFAGQIRFNLGPSGSQIPVFRSNRLGRLSRRQGQRIFKKYARAAGLPSSTSIHSLRHTFASRLADATGDAYLIRQALRHGRLETSALYVETSTRRLVNGLEKMGPVQAIRPRGK